MPLALDATAMVVNKIYPLATTTSEDTVSFTGASLGTPIAVIVTSSVAWAISDASGNLASKIPMGAGGGETIRLVGPMTYYVMNQSASGTFFAFRPV